DGFPNSRAVSTLVSASGDSYYPIRINNPQNLSSGSNVEWPATGTYADAEVFSVVQQVCAQTTATPPGYSTVRKPALVYCIGYGSIFDPANSSTSSYTKAVTFLQSIQYYGNTSAATTTPLQSYQLIYGTPTQRINAMQTAFTNIMQAGVQVSLI